MKVVCKSHAERWSSAFRFVTSLETAGTALGCRQYHTIGVSCLDRGTGHIHPLDKQTQGMNAINLQGNGKR